MKNRIHFSKIEATGNDFIVIDAQDFTLEALTDRLIRRMCQRHFSIGADGLIFMDDLKMRYFNADGSIGAMCGNGLRAATLFLQKKEILSSNNPTFLEADDGLHEVVVQEQSTFKVEIRIQDTQLPKPNPNYELPDHIKILGFFNTGVPHLVLAVEKDLDTIDVDIIGKKLRFDLTFQPQGTNVNFTSITKEKNVHLRTYERGVEAETLACGTGATATYLAYQCLGKVADNELMINTRGGQLNVSQEKGKTYLTGQARLVFTGDYPLDDFTNKKL